MKIINDKISGDYHIHSSTLSDGMNSIDEIVIQAGILKYKEIAITDHNQEYLKGYGFKVNTHYSILSSGRWKNIHNNVHILFGVEADLLNENGDICDKIQNISTEFMILSAHQKIYSGDAGLIKKGPIRLLSKKTRYPDRKNRHKNPGQDQIIKKTDVEVFWDRLNHDQGFLKKEYK